MKTLLKLSAAFVGGYIAGAVSFVAYSCWNLLNGLED